MKRARGAEASRAPGPQTSPPAAEPPIAVAERSSRLLADPDRTRAEQRGVLHLPLQSKLHDHLRSGRYFGANRPPRRTVRTRTTVRRTEHNTARDTRGTCRRRLDDDSRTVPIMVGNERIAENNQIRLRREGDSPVEKTLCVFQIHIYFYLLFFVI